MGARRSPCHGSFSGIFAELEFGICFLRKEAMSQVAPWVGALRGTRLGEAAGPSAIDESMRMVGPVGLEPTTNRL